MLTFGESMVVFNPQTTGPFRHVPTFARSIGGAESNVAIGLMRLGRTAGWVSKVSPDAMGMYVLSAIRGEGVDVSRCVRAESGFTGLIVKERPGLGDPNVYFYRRGSAASTMSPAEFPVDLVRQARFLHATGIFPALSPNCLETTRTALRAAREAGVPILFDPNMRRKLWAEEEARPVMLEMAAQATVLLPGLDEAELLVGPGEPEALVRRLLALGPAVVALKLGPEGALLGASDSGKVARVRGRPLDPVDTVGAGDAFAAAFLTGLLEGASPEEAAAMGCAAGALATQVAGDIEGLPFRDQVERFLGRAMHFTR
ncbi:MAG: sugar kinase [Bacillota bacterium]